MKRPMIAIAAALGATFSLAQPAMAAEDITCEATQLTLYFQNDNAELTTYAQDVIDMAALDAMPCTVATIETTALASDGSDAQTRLQLMEARSTAVVSALAERGIYAPTEINMKPVNVAATAMPSGRAVQVTLQLIPPNVG